MATGGRKPRAKWTSDVERKLIDIWADILKELDRKMTRKKESIATIWLNVYISQELNSTEQITEKAVCNKIDSMMTKGKAMYVNYQKKGETGKEFTEDDAELNLEAAEIAWPNFKTFYRRFKDHPSLGLGAVEDSAVAPGPSGIREEVVATEEEGATNTPDSSRCPSRLASGSVGSGSDKEEEEEELTVPPPKKKQKEMETPLARIGRKKGKGTGSAQFLMAFEDMQEQAQQRTIEHERKLQEEAVAFQVKIDQDRAKFEAEMATRLQQQNSQFQMLIMQQNQTFQAELLKKLFEKKDP